MDSLGCDETNSNLGLGALDSYGVPASHGPGAKRVRMGYPAFSMTFLTFFIAKDAGIYKKHGLDVDMVQMAGAVQTSALVANGFWHIYLEHAIKPTEK